MTTNTTANKPAAQLAGQAAYYNGDIRAYPVLAPAAAMPGSKASREWAAAARDWYRGYDIARLTDPTA